MSDAPGADVARRNRRLWSAHVGFHAAAWVALVAGLGLNLPGVRPILWVLPLSGLAGLAGLAIPAFRAGVGTGLLRTVAAVSVLALAPALLLAR
mgnify:CR=1 FL=1